ncbi:MAG: T9SS C-terminal target domain-containing protein [Bacteroidia bacterium]|nr:MAG: T9SS C-terminal target domain-containing protein [Bacteroidia bacterium]
MKKFTFLFALLLAVSMSFGQIVLHEDFGGGQMPPDGWSISAFATNWSVQSTANAGGVGPEARFNWSPQFSGSSNLISPSLDLSGNDSGVLLLSFKHMLDHFGGPYTLGVAARTNGGAWNTVWQILNPTGNVPAQEVSIDLDGDMVTSDDFQFSFFFSGNSYNINFWYIDDVLVMIPQEFDLAVNSIDVPDLIAGSTVVEGTVLNLGTDVIESFDLHWQLDDGDVHTTSFSGLSIELGEQFHFEADDFMDPDSGTYELHVFISNVNGETEDNNPDNDSLSKTISVAFDSVARRPLFEMFTSSTCPPCATFNNGFFNNFAYNNADDMSLIKYQMNWPGAGDPYFTPEGGIRRTYYGVSGVPNLFLEGNQLATSGAVVTNALQQALQVPSFMAIEGFYDIDGDMISIDGSIMPFADFPQSRLHVVIIESVTYGNTGTNGETEFHHVMHKMMPNAQGTVVTLSALEEYTFSFSHDMSTTNVEEMEDLMVVVFVQNHGTKEIYQSAYLTSGKFVSFNIANGETDVEPDVTIEAIYDEPVTFLDGSEITNDNAHELFVFETESGDAVPFSVFVTEDNKIIGIQPDNMLDFLTTYVIHIEDVLGADTDKTIGGGSVSFTTRDTYGTPVITFDLDDGAIEIPLDQTFVITSNQPVWHADGSDITHGTLPDIIHFHTQAGGEAVPFDAEINEDHTEIHIMPLEMLVHNTTYVLELQPVMGIDGQVTDPESIHFTTEDQTAVSSPDLSEVNIYPNPASSALFVEIPAIEGPAMLRVSDMAGNRVLEMVLQDTQVRIDVSVWKDGIYLVEVFNGKQKEIRRVSIVR